jgi:hypothetical protein
MSSPATTQLRWQRVLRVSRIEGEENRRQPKLADNDAADNADRGFHGAEHARRRARNQAASLADGLRIIGRRGAKKKGGTAAPP